MSRRIFLALVLLGLTGCWSGYASRAGIHAELLSAMASKLVSQVEAGRQPAVERMGEYVYPAKRAREFLQSYASYGEYVSYQTLAAMLPRYEALVRKVDAGRAAGIDWSGEIDALLAEDAELRRLAAEIEQSLKEKH